jgi:hypothetical protein
MGNFEVKIYYSTFCTYDIDAENKEEALIKARKLSIKEKDILTNLESWDDADDCMDIKQ